MLRFPNEADSREGSSERVLKGKQVVMRPEQTIEEGQQVAEDLMEKLCVSKESLVTGAYMDLLLKGHKET